MRPSPPGRQKSRLLLLIPELLTGGAARVVNDQARAFAPFFELREAVFNERHGMDFAGERPVLSLDERESGGPLRPLLNLVHRARRLRRIKRSLSIDLTISHLDGAHRVSLLSGGRDVKVLVVHGSLAHDSTIAGLKGFVTKRLLVPSIYNMADKVVCVSRDLVDELVSLGVRRGKIATINNIVEMRSIRLLADAPIPAHERAIFEGPPTLITTSRLHPAKNPLGLLEAFAELLRSRPARLVSLGDGPLREAAIGCAERLGLSTWATWRGDAPGAQRDVYFLGPRENPFPYLSAADLFVLPSFWEGFPLSLCEALACGVPALASDCPTGPREILAPSKGAFTGGIEEAERAEFGYLMPLLNSPSSIGAWVRTLARLLDDPSEREKLSRAGLQRIDDFGEDTILPQWLALFEELLKARA